MRCSCRTVRESRWLYWNLYVVAVTETKHLLFNSSAATFEENFVKCVYVCALHSQTVTGLLHRGLLRLYPTLLRALDVLSYRPETFFFFFQGVDRHELLFKKERVLFVRQVTIQIQQTFTPQEWGAGGGSCSLKFVISFLLWKPLSPHTETAFLMHLSLFLRMFCERALVPRTTDYTSVL